MFDPASLKLHDDFTMWCYDFSMGFAIEVPTEAIRHVLPRELYPFEVRPGASLLTMNVLRFADGNQGFDRAFSEITFSVNVVPDILRAGRLPKFAVYVLNIGVSDLGFTRDPYNTDRLPFYPEQLRIDIDPALRKVSCGDANGPIFELRDNSNGHVFGRKEDFFQVFATHGNQLHHGAMTLESDSFEHQVSGAVGRIHRHPIFRGLDYETEHAENYLQLFSQDGSLGIQHYYRLKPLE